MDSPQKFIGEYNFEVEEWFVDKITDIPHESRIEMLEDISNRLSEFPVDDGGWEQTIYGALKTQDKFYKLHYIKDNKDIPLMIDIEYVEVDDYLDAKLRNNSI
jgi:hypothetical protein